MAIHQFPSPPRPSSRPKFSRPSNTYLAAAMSPSTSVDRSHQTAKSPRWPRSPTGYGSAGRSRNGHVIATPLNRDAHSMGSSRRGGQDEGEEEEDEDAPSGSTARTLVNSPDTSHLDKLDKRHQGSSGAYGGWKNSQSVQHGEGEEDEAGEGESAEESMAMSLQTSQSAQSLASGDDQDIEESQGNGDFEEDDRFGTARAHTGGRGARRSVLDGRNGSGGCEGGAEGNAGGGMDVDQDRSQRGGQVDDGCEESEGEFESDDEEEDVLQRVGPVVHLEVRLPPYGPQYRHTDSAISNMLLTHISANHTYVEAEQLLDLGMYREELRERRAGASAAARALGSIERVWIGEKAGPSVGASSIDTTHATMRVHMYRSALEDVEEFAASADDDDEDEAAVPAASIRHLPSLLLEGQWENLIYPDDIKKRLLSYISSMTTMARRGVDPNVTTSNRLVLLHGPPGTGKTSLCRALAQKMIIRAGKHYPSGGRLVEINSHSLFSKWFSESGKLVQKLFSTITEMVQDPDCFVFVMIDEVESLTAARSGMSGGNEPGDAIRVVNALLTQLDKLRLHPNVLVLATSNIPHAIDAAFVDRADIKQYVPLPPPEAVYWILRSCLMDLRDKGMIKPCRIPAWGESVAVEHVDEGHVDVVCSKKRRMNGSAGVGGVSKTLLNAARTRRKLQAIARKCHAAQLSGRFLRRLPTMAYAEYIEPLQAVYDDPPARTIGRWLRAMDMMVDMEIGARRKIGEDVSTALVVKAEQVAVVADAQVHAL